MITFSAIVKRSIGIILIGLYIVFALLLTPFVATCFYIINEKKIRRKKEND